MATDYFNNELQVGDLIVTTCSTSQRLGVIVAITELPTNNVSIYQDALIKIAYAKSELNPTLTYEQRQYLYSNPEEYYQNLVAYKKFVKTYDRSRLLKVSLEQISRMPCRASFDLLMQVQQETIAKQQQKALKKVTKSV